MSNAFANWIGELVSPVVYIGIAFAGVSSLLLILISRFKRVTPQENPQ